MTVESNLDKSIAQAEGLHYFNASTRGAALVNQLAGSFKALERSTQDDPLLYAYQCLDVLPSIAAQVIELEKWCVAVRDATPEQLQESGAQLCH